MALQHHDPCYPAQQLHARILTLRSKAPWCTAHHVALRVAAQLVPLQQGRGAELHVPQDVGQGRGLVEDGLVLIHDAGAHAPFDLNINSVGVRYGGWRWPRVRARVRACLRPRCCTALGTELLEAPPSAAATEAQRKSLQSPAAQSALLKATMVRQGEAWRSAQQPHAHTHMQARPPRTSSCSAGFSRSQMTSHSSCCTTRSCCAANVALAAGSMGLAGCGVHDARTTSAECHAAATLYGGGAPPVGPRSRTRRGSSSAQLLMRWCTALCAGGAVGHCGGGYCRAYCCAGAALWPHVANDGRAGTARIVCAGRAEKRTQQLGGNRVRPIAAVLRGQCMADGEHAWAPLRRAMTAASTPLGRLEGVFYSQQRAAPAPALQLNESTVLLYPSTAKCSCSAAAQHSSRRQPRRPTACHHA